MITSVAEMGRGVKGKRLFFAAASVFLVASMTVRSVTAQTVWLDEFNQPNGALGAGWSYDITSDQPNLVVNSNAIANDGASYPQAYWSTSFAADQEVFVKLGSLLTGEYAIWCRISDPNSIVQRMAFVEFNDQSGAFKSLVGLDVAVYGSGVVVPALPVGGSLRLRCVGSEMSLHYRNDDGSAWMLAGSATQADVLGGGFIGLEIGGNTRFDAFGGGLSSATATATSTITAAVASNTATPIPSIISSAVPTVTVDAATATATAIVPTAAIAATDTAAATAAPATETATLLVPVGTGSPVPPSSTGTLVASVTLTAGAATETATSFVLVTPSAVPSVTPVAGLSSTSEDQRFQFLALMLSLIAGLLVLVIVRVRQ